MHFSAEGQAGLTVFGTGLTVFLNQGSYPSLKPSSGTWLNNILWIRAFMIHCLQQCKPELYLMMLGTRPVWMGLVDVPLMRREDCVVVHRTGSRGQWNCKPAGQCKCCIKQQFSLNVQHAVAISPVQLVKESFLLSKQSHGTSRSENQHFSHLHLHEISPVLFLQ